MIDVRRSLLEAIFGWASQDQEGRGISLKTLDDVRKTLREFGSETDDNMHAIEALEVVKSEHGRGLGIQGAGASLADILHQLESVPVPPEIQEACPALRQDQWEASLRIVTLILVALEQ